jgi:hypothetical protein
MAGKSKWQVIVDLAQIQFPMFCGFGPAYRLLKIPF